MYTFLSYTRMELRTMPTSGVGVVSGHINRHQKHLDTMSLHLKKYYNHYNLLLYNSAINISRIQSKFYWTSTASCGAYWTHRGYLSQHGLLLLTP